MLNGAIASILALALAAAAPSGVPPSVAADLDGDGSVEIVTAVPARGSVRLEVRDAAGRKLAQARAPAPSADVVPIALTSAQIGSAGALMEVAATTDASECRSIWRYHDGALARLAIRDGAGKVRPDCEPLAGWTYRWDGGAPGRTSAWMRERVEKVAAGTLATRETYAFAGFSLDLDPSRSVAEINGIPIPSWYGAVLYTRAALETLYGRFGLAALKKDPTLRIRTDHARGVFALEFQGPGGPLEAAVDALSSSAAEVTLAARAGEKTAHVSIRLGGDGTVPYEVRIEGLGAPFDRTYAPAGSWRGGGRKMFPSAADEVASEDLVGVWGDRAGKNKTIAIEGEPPYRVRMDDAVFTVDMESAAAPVDVVLVPAGTADRTWGLVLRGPNAMDRLSLVCGGLGAERTCRSEGGAETLRRIGARVNVR